MKKRPIISKSGIINGLRSLSGILFSLLLIMTLSTPSWRYGPFSWFPFLRLPDLAGGPVSLGIFNLLPFLLAVFWISSLILRRLWQSEDDTTLNLGRPGITLPFLGLTAIGILSLDPEPNRRTFIQGGGLVLAWLVYLYLLNERPRLKWPLALIITLQGIVAAGQFFKQSDLGLVFLGELPLIPIFEGNSVLWARDQPWLRAYGLTAHPNLLGAILAALLLILLPALVRAKGWQRLGLSMAFLMGLAGLVLSFSRAAGLAYLIGLGYWLVIDRGLLRGSPTRKSLWSIVRKPLIFLPLIILLIFLLFFGDLLLSRVISLETNTEATSLNQRLSDAKIAIQIISDHPLKGVGLGNYTDTAKAIDLDAARVHNVILFVGAELGFVGLLFLFWLFLSPIWYEYERLKMANPFWPTSFPPWLAVLIIGLFDTTLWLTSNWQTAILFALIAANLTTSLIDENKSKG